MAPRKGPRAAGLVSVEPRPCFWARAFSHRLRLAAGQAPLL